MYKTPQDCGRRDWHHNDKGQVDYYWEKPSQPVSHNDDDYFRGTPLEDQHYKENCTEEALDNLMYERHWIAARRDAFDEWERNERIYN